MGSESVFLTANADTVYFLGVVDLTSGPMVVETPPQALGVIDDMWWQWIIDFGLSGPDRGEGGRFLLVPPGYDGTLPDSGYHVGHSRTSRALLLGRSFLWTTTRPRRSRRSRARRRSIRTPRAAPARASRRCSKAATARRPDRPRSPTRCSSRAAGKSFNTVPPSDFGFFELINEAVQDEPAGSTNAELMGQLAAIGIVKGEPFEPDERMRRDPRGRRRRRQRELAGAVLRRATSGRVHVLRRARRGSTCCGSAATRSRRRRRWSRKRGSSRSRRPVSGSCTPGRRSCTQPPGSRPRCACGSPGSGRSTSWPPGTPTANRLDGAKTYQVTLPPDIPAARFWSITALRQRDALDARDTAALPARREPVLPDAGGDRERRRLDDHHVRPGAAGRHVRRATGSRRRKARAGSRSSASTARSSRSSTRAGGRARSSSWLASNRPSNERRTMPESDTTPRSST